MLFAYGMENVLLCTLNAKYIHSSLALRYLQSYCQTHTKFKLKIKEFTINQNTSDIMAEIYINQPDVLGFSCYIWNIRQILELCKDYKKVAPNTVIVLGGPEVSYDAEQILTENPYIDFIVRGEGEETLKELLWAINGEIDINTVLGITFRDSEQIHHNADRELISNLDDIPFPYEDELDKLHDRIVYYESSRGCPFKCSYCLSSNSGGIRYLSLARVKKDLDQMLSYHVREIKFVDRTFNCHEKRAKEIIEYIVLNHGSTKIHFEIDAGLFSDAMLEYIATVPKDLLNFEIGIQSTYEPALLAVKRKQNWADLNQKIRKIKSHNNIHLHLDLIAGLPGEDWANFTRSFDMVYSLRPDVLQLGFLKILKGTPLLQEAEQYNYQYQSQSPYQVLSNRDLTYQQTIALTQVEDILNKYYNSGDMVKTIGYIGERIYDDRNFEFFNDFAAYWHSQGLFAWGHKKDVLYSILHKFILEYHPDHSKTVDELLKYDYLCRNHKYGLPQGLESHNPPNINDIIYSFTKNKKFVQQHLPDFQDKTAHEIKKLVHIEYLMVNPITYDVYSEIRLMFVYDPVAGSAGKVMDLESSQFKVM